MIESNKKLYNIYSKTKSIPLLGQLVKFARNGYVKSVFQKKSLERRDIGEVKRILKVLHIRENEIKSLLREAKKINANTMQFGAGYSGLFDIMILYTITRILKPNTVVETGVASGRSSTAILEALEMNKKGMLYSIDLPQYYSGETPETFETEEGNIELSGFIPQGKQPGWLVPDHLRSRWNLHLGSSQDLLPKILQQTGSIQLFYHDSDHSYKNMCFEFEHAWRYLDTSAFLLSDDVSWNNAFNEFVGSADHVEKIGVYRNFGIIKKND